MFNVQKCVCVYFKRRWKAVGTKASSRLKAIFSHKIAQRRFVQHLVIISPWSPRWTNERSNRKPTSTTCLMTSVAQITYTCYRIVECLMKNGLATMGKWSLPSLCWCHGMCLEGMRKTTKDCVPPPGFKAFDSRMQVRSVTRLHGGNFERDGVC